MTVIHSGLTRAQQRDLDWEAYQAAYAAAYEQAVAEKICFCRCGCKNPVEALAPVTGAPTRCDDCRRGSKDDHAVIPRPVETFPWEKYEDPETEPVQPRRRVVGVSREARERAADVRADVKAAVRTGRAEWRARKTVNLNAVHITEAVPDGSYLVRDDADGWVKVEVERHQRGPLEGFVEVTLSFGDNVVEKGLQWPQPARAGHPQVYQGPFSHLVKRLVDNPSKARSDFDLAMGL